MRCEPFSKPWRPADRGASINCPVLVLSGEHDPFCPPPLASALASEIPHGEFIRVADAGHDIHTGHAEWLADEAVGWLRKRDAPWVSAPTRYEYESRLFVGQAL